MITDDDNEIISIIMPMMFEEGVIVPHDIWGYDMSPEFARVLDVSGAEESSRYYQYTLEQVNTAVDQFCHDCGYDRRCVIFGGVMMILNVRYPDRMRRAMSQLKRVKKYTPAERAGLGSMLLRQEGAKRRMR